MPTRMSTSSNQQATSSNAIHSALQSSRRKRTRRRAHTNQLPPPPHQLLPMVHKMATTSPIEPCDRLQEEASSPRREEATTPTRSHSNTNKSTAAKCKCNQLKCNRRRQLRADVKTNKIKFLMLITAALVLLQSFTARAAQGLLQLQASERLEAGHRPARAAASSQMAVLLDTTQESSLGWTRYPDGGPGGQPGRTPGWSEESFLQMERDINWRSFVTCDVAYTSVNNWLWTPYIERGDANRLYIEIKFTMRDCNLFPQLVLSCKETFALLYQEVDGPIQQSQPGGGSSSNSLQSASNVSFAQADNFQLIDAIAADEGRFTQSNSDVVINTEIRSVPVTKRGLYFAFRDQGACLSLIAIKVYALKCPQLVTNLAKFNATPTGRDLTSLVAVEGECVANSMQIEQPRMFCSADGQWNAMSSGQCKCLPGFEPVQNHTKCQACPVGRFKSQAGDSPCLPCPERSFSSSQGATECKCHEGYFRSPKDSRSAACTQPPGGPPQNLTATYVDSSSVVLQWQAPARHLTGQRDDLTYKLLCDSCDFNTLVSSPQFFANFSETKCVLTGLQPTTSYRFVVYVANGVSLQAAREHHQLQFSEITIQTSKVQPQTTSSTLSTQNGGFQLLPIYNFRAFAGARGSDMLLAWDAQSSGSPSSSSSDLLLDSASLGLGSGLSSGDQQPSLFEIKFQPRALLNGGHLTASSSTPQDQLLRRSPYPLLFDQQQQATAPSVQSQSQQQQSVTTTNKALALYTLQPRTEYAFQIRAKWTHSSQWTDWSEPIYATTGAGPVNNQNSLYNQAGGFLAPSLLSQQQPPVDFPIPFDPSQSWPQSPPFGNLAVQQPQPASSQSSWLGSVALVLLCSLVVSIVFALMLVHYRNSMCLKSLSSSLSGGLMGSNVGSTYAGVYNGGTSSDLIAGVASTGPGGNYGSAHVAGGLIYHNAGPTTAGPLQHHHLHTTLSAGSNGALITGSNSTSRSSSGTGNVVQNFLAATLGQLAGHNNHHHHQHNHHITTKTLDHHQAQAQQQQQNLNGKLFLHHHQHSGGSPNGLLETQQPSHMQRNHYHQMLGNVNHTLLFSGQGQYQPAQQTQAQGQQQQIPIVPPTGGLQLVSQNQSQQQQLASGNSPPQVADLFGSGQGQHLSIGQQQQSKYGNSRALSGPQQQQQQYGLANLHDAQMHIYDDLEVVSQSRASPNCSPGQQQQQQTLSAMMQQQQGNIQRQAIYASTRELYEPTTKLVIGHHNHLQQQQRQQRDKFYKDRGEDEFYDE